MKSSLLLHLPTCDNKNRAPSTRELRDQELQIQIKRIYEDNQCVYGVRKIYRQLRREGSKVARCTVERLMRRVGIFSINRGKKNRTTFSVNAPCSKDLVNRKFTVNAPNRLWVSDLTYVRTYQGFTYVAFVTDAYSRMILGWQVSNTHAK